MYKIIRNTANCEDVCFKVLAIANTKEKLRWYLKQEGIEYYGSNPLHGEMYTINGDFPEVGHAIYCIVQSEIIVLD